MDAPKPVARPKPKGFEKIGEAAQQAGTAMEKLSAAIPQNKTQGPGPRAPFKRREHLTQRPFVNPAIVSLREGMKRNVHIKKK